MEISFSSLLKKLFLIAIGFAAYRIISSTSHITVQVVTAAAACLAPALLVKLDVLHPWCWYGGLPERNAAPEILSCMKQSGAIR